MALTIQEVFAGADPPPAFGYWAIDIIVTVMQEDGRVGYIQGTGNVTNVVGLPQYIKLYDTDFVFNDRNRFRGDADRVEIAFSPMGTNACRAGISLLTYGTRYECDFALPQSASTTGKLYQGFGTTIGFGAGQALHLLTFNNLRVIRTPYGDALPQPTRAP